MDSATVILFSSESMLPVPFWLSPENSIWSWDFKFWGQWWIWRNMLNSACIPSLPDALIAVWVLLKNVLAALRHTKGWLECHVDRNCRVVGTLCILVCFNIQCYTSSSKSNKKVSKKEAARRQIRQGKKLPPSPAIFLFLQVQKQLIISLATHYHFNLSHACSVNAIHILHSTWMFLLGSI